ncbi:hypothetical protein DW741_03545 [Ruminococcaceae bacterium AM28-23LB]|nr:hypothetical protein DW741_03545 [Ruminococcaceae bacterium AM28-23LB]
MCLLTIDYFSKEAAGLLCAKSLDRERKQVVLSLIHLQKAAACAWLFALFKGGAPRWQTFFARAYTTYRSQEKLGAAARRQPLAKTRKRGQGLFFEAL